LVLRFFIIKLFMCANRKSTLIDYFENSRCRPDGSNEYSMSREEFQKMHQRFHFHIQQYHLFDEKFCNLKVGCTGRIAVFDEKKKKCPSYYKHAKCPKRIWCHWISELAVWIPSYHSLP